VVTGAEQTMAEPAGCRRCCEFRFYRQQASAQNPCQAKKQNRQWPSKPLQCNTVEPMRDDTRRWRVARHSPASVGVSKEKIKVLRGGGAEGAVESPASWICAKNVHIMCVRVALQ
jgi:hypothetical protein